MARRIAAKRGGVFLLALASAGLAAAVVESRGDLEESRRELERLRGQLTERQARVRHYRTELQRVAARVEQVVRSSAAAHSRAAHLRQVARLEESREPEASPAWRSSASEALHGWPGGEADVTLEQLDWLEAQTAALNESVVLFGALLRDGRSNAVGGMPTRWPVRGEVTSRFGPRPAVGGVGTEFHPGIDIRAAMGTPVLAAGSGVVALVQRMSGYGLTVVVDHGAGVSTLYAHLAGTLVAVGDQVRRGQVLGTVGRSGRTTGPHLHYEVRFGAEPFDPACYLARDEGPEIARALTTGG